MENLTVGVLGLGVFGRSIVSTLKHYDCDIIAIDDHEENINYFEAVLARGIVGDITDKELLQAAGIDTCDYVVVSTGENLEASVLAVMHCKTLGVPTVIAKAKSQITMDVLEKVGADRVISPERETGRSLAKLLLHKNTTEVIQLDKDVAIVEFIAPSHWVGQQVLDLDLRHQYKLNIIGFRAHKTAALTVDFSPSYIIQDHDLIVAVTDNATIDHFDQLFH